MASEKKIRKLEEGTPMTIPQEDQQPRPLFPKTDAILEVEGREIHINKQILADRSPVFKKMFESDFKEKQMHKIPLPGKKYEDFEKFVFLIYNPGDQCLITSDTVTVILSLSVEYQVTALQDLCKSFLTKTLERVQNHESDRIDIPTLLRYIECSTTYDLPNIFEQAVNLLIRYDVELLKQAGVKMCISGELWTEILEKRNSLMTTFLENVAGKGITADVTTTLDLISGMECGSQCDGQLMLRHEALLTDICKDPLKHKLTYDALVEFINAGERFKLQSLLSCAIELASKCKTYNLKQALKYHEISDEIKLQIAEKRSILKENYTTSGDIRLQ